MSFTQQFSFYSYSNFVRNYCLIACLVFWQVAVAVADKVGHDDGHHRRDGYNYGQAIPVNCLNRTIDKGDHVSDSLGNLQYIPFPTCNETSRPLSLHYGVSETITCTIDSLSDTSYHLLEYYVHSDVPLGCRVPTLSPLGAGAGIGGPKSKSQENEKEKNDNPTAATVAETEKRNNNGDGELGVSGPNGEQPYTPLTIALQGTLQQSHLHIWTDMNVIMHSIASNPGSSKRKNKNKSKKKSPGYVVAGTSYSVPEYDGAGSSSKSNDKNKKTGKIVDDDNAIIKAARDPWTSGHGTKVIRGEPLTFTFHVDWIEGPEGIHWPSLSSSSSSPSSSFLQSNSTPASTSSFFSKLPLFVIAAGIGSLAATCWERGKRRRGHAGDGILGVPAVSSSSLSSSPGISYGNGGGYGYGGYSAPTGVGYGGYSGGKKD